MHNFKLYPALHKLGSRSLIHFLQCTAHVESWCAVNVAVRRYSSWRTVGCGAEYSTQVPLLFFGHCEPPMGKAVSS